MTPSRCCASFRKTLWGSEPMKLKQAKALRDEITAKTGAYCTVPLKHGPDKYFARIFRWSEEFKATLPVDFESRTAWLLDFRTQEQIKLARQLKSRPRSPIEILIDRACGVE